MQRARGSGPAEGTRGAGAPTSPPPPRRAHGGGGQSATSQAVCVLWPPSARGDPAQSRRGRRKAKGWSSQRRERTGQRRRGRADLCGPRSKGLLAAGSRGVAGGAGQEGGCGNLHTDHGKGRLADELPRRLSWTQAASANLQVGPQTSPNGNARTERVGTNMGESQPGAGLRSLPGAHTRRPARSARGSEALTGRGQTPRNPGVREKGGAWEDGRGSETWGRPSPWCCGSQDPGGAVLLSQGESGPSGSRARTSPASTEVPEAPGRAPADPPLTLRRKASSCGTRGRSPARTRHAEASAAPGGPGAQAAARPHSLCSCPGSKRLPAPAPPSLQVGGDGRRSRGQPCLQVSSGVPPVGTCPGERSPSLSRHTLGELDD